MYKKRNNKLYNYLVNTFDLSRKTILEYIESRLEDLINKHVDCLLKSKRVESIIMDRVAYFVKNGEIKSYWREANTFQDIVKEQVKSVVEDQLKKNCEIKFQYTPNSIQFIKES